MDESITHNTHSGFALQDVALDSRRERGGEGGGGVNGQSAADESTGRADFRL